VPEPTSHQPGGTTMPDHAFLSLLEISEQLRTRSISPVEITEEMLARIEKLDTTLRSYAHVCADLARAAAKRAEAEIGRGKIRGPLHGVPIAVKDLCAMEGTPTRIGSPFVDWKPGIEATAVVRLRNAGAVILGKLQLTEGAFSNHHPDIAPPVNPWRREQWTGVSSSGSGVATAAGLCFGSLGTDTGGSIRFPSHCCGVTGLKPTWGRVSRAGVFPLAESLDHIGPMVRSAGDAAAMLGVLAGPDPADPTSAAMAVPDYATALDGSLHGLKVGFDERYCSEDLAPEIGRMLRDAVACLRERGATVVPIAVPSGHAVAEQWTLLCGIETAVAHEERYPACASEYGPELTQLIELGRGANPLDIVKAQADRRTFAGLLARLFEEVDMYVSPTSQVPAPTTEELNQLLAAGSGVADTVVFTAPTDGSGHPALCLPGGFTEQGVPYGFQLIGRPFGEAELLRAGHAYQLDTRWHLRHPPV
jgi:amidase